MEMRLFSLGGETVGSGCVAMERCDGDAGTLRKEEEKAICSREWVRERTRSWCCWRECCEGDTENCCAVAMDEWLEVESAGGNESSDFSGC